jgi:ubiquinol-cytochrome c reductase cytochrome b subunit
MLAWLEERTGAISALTEFLTEDVPGGASYWYVFGSATMFALILQVVTGIFLTFYYAPSAATAWESTKFIYEKVPLGSFVIGLHYWGATAMIALVVMHLTQVLLWGAYKKPREVQWVVGVLLFLFTLVMGLTGYLLPWDLNAFFASQVAINIAGTVPVMGAAIQTFLQDGATIGTLTINRFFGIHVWLMPALLLALTALHLAIFRHNGGAGPAVDEAELKKMRPGRFWPNQLFMDAVVSFVVFALIVGLSIASPAPLDAKADPNQTSFQPFPAWYFLALFGLLNDLPPNLELLGTVILPGGLMLVLLLLPWIDRNPSRRMSKRPWLVSLTAITVIATVLLSFQAQAQIAARRSTPGVVAVASGKTEPAGGAADAKNGGAGAKIYAANCSSCHGAGGVGMPGTFPPLAGNTYVTGSPKAVAHTLLYGLSGPIKVAGTAYTGQMPAWKGTLSNADIANVITYIRTSWGNKAKAVTEAQVAAVKK